LHSFLLCSPSLVLPMATASFAFFLPLVCRGALLPCPSPAGDAFLSPESEVTRCGFYVSVAQLFAPSPAPSVALWLPALGLPLSFPSFAACVFPPSSSALRFFCFPPSIRSWSPVPLSLHRAFAFYGFLVHRPHLPRGACAWSLVPCAPGFGPSLPFTIDGHGASVEPPGPLCRPAHAPLCARLPACLHACFPLPAATSLSPAVRCGPFSFPVPSPFCPLRCGVWALRLVSSVSSCRPLVVAPAATYYLVP